MTCFDVLKFRDARFATSLSKLSVFATARLIESIGSLPCRTPSIHLWSRWQSCVVPRCRPSANWQMYRRDGRVLIAASVLEHVASHLNIPAAVSVLVPEAPEYLCGCVPLLGGRGLVIDQDSVDDWLEWPDQRGVSLASSSDRRRSGMSQDMPDTLS